MFTGLVQTLATVVEHEPRPPAVRLVVRALGLADAPAVGASMAVNGCCLTAVDVRRDSDGHLLAFEAGPETLSRTNLEKMIVGSQVNLESSLKIGDPLGGHWVTGHVDGIGTLSERTDQGAWSTLWFSVAPQLCGQMASKGSVAVDGVSLTLVDVEANRFSVALIPHTLSVTTLGSLVAGDRVNIETDLLAKYVERQLLLAGRVDSPATNAARDH